MEQSATLSEKTSGTKRHRKESTTVETGGSSTRSGQPSSMSQKGRKPRGPTCLAVMATGAKERKLVEWNGRGQPVGDVSVKFSSTMGVIVRETVPIVVKSWHGVDDSVKETLWKLLMYLVDVCYKPFVVQQMGKLWRSWKSGLSTGIRKIMESKSTKTERTHQMANLRPHYVSLVEWEQFNEGRLTEEWQEKSLKMREIRAKQIVSHTMSREGYGRKVDKHDKLNPDKPWSKPELWIEAHVSKKKTSAANEAKIQEIKKKMEEAPSNGDGDDILTQVLGKERPGRIRGLGSGVTKSKLCAQSQSDAKYVKLEAELKKVTARSKKIEAALISKLGINFDDDDDGDGDGDGESGGDAPAMSKSKVQCDVNESASPEPTPKSGQGSSHQLSINDKCKLINWKGNGEEVAKGYISAVGPNDKVHGYELGPDCYRVGIEEVFVSDAHFYRSEPEFSTLGDSVGSTIAWPIKYLVFDV